MKLIHCPGCRLYYLHKLDTPFRCGACHDATHTTISATGTHTEHRNTFGKIVDRKQIRTGPLKAGPSEDMNFGYTVYSGFGVR